MSLALTIYTNVGNTGVELASYRPPSATSAVEIWDKIPSAPEVTLHYLVIMEGGNHIDSKFIDTLYVGQLLEMWGQFDKLYQQFQENG